VQFRLAAVSSELRRRQACHDSERTEDNQLPFTTGMITAVSNIRRQAGKALAFVLGSAALATTPAQVEAKLIPKCILVHEGRTYVKGRAISLARQMARFPSTIKNGPWLH
jgi:hypothetical protein